MKFYSVIFILTGLLLPIDLLFAQTCSCAGAPLISSQSLGTSSQGNLVLGLTYEYKDISDLYSESTHLENKNQRRSTATALLEVNYGITERLSLTGTVTYNQKYRETGLQTSGTSESLTTSGMGDGLFLLKYSLHNQTLWEPYQIAVGGGAKIPFGKTSLQNNGFTLNADMQPGTGAWDGILWAYFSRTLRKNNSNLFMTGTYRRTGANERFKSSDKYKFGNEFVSVIGALGPIVNNLSYIFMIRYHSTSSDQRNGSSLPSTGGKWIKLKSGIGYQLINNLNMQLSGQLPVYQYLEGTQPTTSYIISGSIFFSFNKNKEGIIYGEPLN